MKSVAVLWHSDRTEEPFSTEILDVSDSLADDELLIRSECAGICGSDVHVVRWRSKPGTYVLGHELCGIVEAAGGRFTDANGQQLRSGDRVVAESIIPCKCCEFCREADSPRYRNNGYAMCPHSQLIGGQPLGKAPHKIVGAFAERIHIPGNGLVHRIAPAVAPETAVLTEPLTVAIKAVWNSDISPRERVLVMGPGPIGLLTVLVLRDWGVEDILLSGTRTDQARLALGRRFGAATVNVDETPLPDKLRELTSGWMPTRVIDATGSGRAMEQALLLVARGGIYTSLGGQPDDIRVAIAPNHLLRNKIELRFSHTGSKAFPQAIAMLEQGKYPFRELVSHVFSPWDVAKAFSALINQPETSLKVLLDFRSSAGTPTLPEIF